MKKEMKNWNGTIELRPHWSSHTQAPKIVRNRRQRPDARSSSSSSGQVFKVVKVVKLALPEPRPRQVFRVYTYTWYTQAPKSPPEALPASSQHAAQQSLYVCRCVADASQRAHSISFQGIHLYMVYMVYTGAEIAARGPPSELTACCTPATGLQRRKHLRGVESLSVLSLGGAFAF